MTTEAAIRREKAPSDGLGNLLEQLTVRHASMLERFGEIVGENEPPPDDPVSYAATMARGAAAIEAAPDAHSKRLALLRHGWRLHEQIGRLAVYVADYEAAHGDPGNVPAMRELGADHLDLAAGLRETASDEDARQEAGDGTPFELFISDETRAEAAANWTAKGIDGKSSGKDGNEL